MLLGSGLPQDDPSSYEDTTAGDGEEDPAALFVTTSSGPKGKGARQPAKTPLSTPAAAKKKPHRMSTNQAFHLGHRLHARAAKEAKACVAKCPGAARKATLCARDGKVSAAPWQSAAARGARPALALPDLT